MTNPVAIISSSGKPQRAAIGTGRARRRPGASGTMGRPRRVGHPRPGSVRALELRHQCRARTLAAPRRLRRVHHRLQRVPGDCYGAHRAPLAEPMIVFGVGRYHARLTEYFGVLLRGHWLITSGASLLLAVVAGALAVAGSRAFGLALLALSVAVPWVLLLWLMRRICYIRVGPHLAASGGFLYMTALMIGVSGLLAFGRLSPQSALILIGVGAVGAGLWIRSRLVLEPKPTSSEFRRSVLVGHWDNGRWAVGTGVFGAITLNIYYVVLPVRHGLESAAALKAMMNLVMPDAALVPRAFDGAAADAGKPARHPGIRRLRPAIVAAVLIGGHRELARGRLAAHVARGRLLRCRVCLLLLALVARRARADRIRDRHGPRVLRCVRSSGPTRCFERRSCPRSPRCWSGIPATLAWGPAFAAAGLGMGSAVSIFSMSRSLRGCLREWEHGSSAPGHPEDLAEPRQTMSCDTLSGSPSRFWPTTTTGARSRTASATPVSASSKSA